MLDAFESRLADVLADALEDVALVGVIARPRDGLADPSAASARVILRVLDAAPAARLGDDRQDVSGDKGSWSLRTVLHLAGTLLFQIEVGPAGSVAAQRAQRGVLMGALDALLLVMQGQAMREGRALATSADQGFEIDGVRLSGLAFGVEDDEDDRRVEVRFAFEGRFWPVGAAVAGDAIATIPTRVAFLPVRMPGQVVVQAGGGETDIPVSLDLRALEGATPTLVARLMGAEPPGRLLGQTTDLPPGSFGYHADADGVFRVVYRPPGTLSGRARVRVGLRLSHADRASVALGELTIDVVGT